MNRVLLALGALLGALLLVLLPLGLVACGGPDGAGASDGEAASQQLHTCPMHPEIVEDRAGKQGPGSCPICGMDLVPLVLPGTTGDSTAPAALDPTVSLPGVVVQDMAVRTAVLERQTIYKHLRTVGEVEVAEDQVSVVNLRVSGWAERVRVDRTGDPVKQGQVLFDLYSPELVAAQEELLRARASAGPDSPLATAARRRLELWGISAQDIDKLIDMGGASRTLPVRAPGSGFVLSKEVVEGARVAAGADLYRIGNLTKIWVKAELYELDAPWVSVGQPARMELSFQRGTVLEGQVAYVYPTLTEASRTLRVRLEFDNPGVQLKPGMFATVSIEYRRRDDVLAVPTEAILHTGREEIVFVSLGEGRFAPRVVETGLEADHRLTEIRGGLEEGEEIVVSGQFLLDSESQLQEALQKMIAGLPPDHGEASSDLRACPMHPQQTSEGPGRCALCGMDLEPVDP